jgi:hypothetical protein
MSSSSQHKRSCEGFFSALSAHNIAEALSFIDPNCEVVWNGEITTRSKDELRKVFEEEYSDSNVSVRIIKYLPSDRDDCVDLLSEENGKQQNEKYTFSKEGKIIRIVTDILPNNWNNRCGNRLRKTTS